MSTAIKVENLSKMYRLGQIGTGTIGTDVQRWITTKILRKEDPFLKIGESNDRTKKGDSDIVWSLKDINFEINQGDAVGIIGRNGAGKSTLLKILSRVTSPTTGAINIKGRVASLLEVGTGFHPELTGKENIYLNGAILGMRKKEITRKLDEIIDFSGVERYIDTPVKRYSSGMYVRLAFAVAAHLESEILIVDEVLAVGDAEFQKKCLGKMGEVSKGEGRTVLFVSHNLSAMLELCKNAILLNHGTILNQGSTNSIISEYYNLLKKDVVTEIKSEYFHLTNFNLSSLKVNPNESLTISFDYKKLKEIEACVAIAIYKDEKSVFSANNILDGCFVTNNNEGKVSIKFDKVGLLPGAYDVVIGIKDTTGNMPLIPTTTLSEFEVTNNFSSFDFNITSGSQLENLASPLKKYQWFYNDKPVVGNTQIMEKLFW